VLAHRPFAIDWQLNATPCKSDVDTLPARHLFCVYERKRTDTATGVT
jgi:hypothetical protein